MSRIEMNSGKIGRLLPAFGCALAVLAAIVVAHPAGEIPMGDEIAYVHSAQELARTGHVTYIGFINAIGGWQFYWGAAAIRLLGSSMLVLRWSTAAVAVMTAFLLHRIFVRVGVRPVLAAAGTLTFCLSPLFLSKATTFLTDVPGVLATLLCLYACLRALEAESVRTTILWLGLATVGNSVLGSVRQLPWLAAIAMVPPVIWLLRKNRAILLGGTGLWAVGLAMDGAMQYWFTQQPYTDREPSLFVGLTPHRLEITGVQGLGTVLETGLLLLPVLLTLTPVLLRHRWPRASYAAGLLFLAGTFALWRIHALWILHIPYMGESFRWPLSKGGAALITGMVVLGLLSLIPTIAAGGGERPARAGSTITQRNLTLILVPFLLGYLLLLILRAYNGGVWDRYLLLPVPVLLVWGMRRYQDQISRPGAILALAVCGGVYATALLHDNFAYERARLGALNQLVSHGVPRTQMTGGWAYDIETELQIRPYVVGPGIRLPKGVTAPASTHYGIDNCEGFQCDAVPDVVPRYAVSNRAEGVLPGFAPVPYRGWVTRSGAFYVTGFP